MPEEYYYRGHLIEDTRTADIDNRIDGVEGDIIDIQNDLASKVDKNTAIIGATKTRVTYDSKGLVTGGEDATTADIADSANKRYMTEAERVIIQNTSGANTGDETQTSIVDKLGFTPADDSEVVHKAGDEEITGNKTFTGNAFSVNLTDSGIVGLSSTDGFNEGRIAIDPNAVFLESDLTFINGLSQLLLNSPQTRASGSLGVGNGFTVLDGSVDIGTNNFSIFTVGQTRPAITIDSLGELIIDRSNDDVLEHAAWFKAPVKGADATDPTHLATKSQLDSGLAAKQDDLGFTPENISNKNQPDGYAGLDGSGRVASAQLPSYVDDVIEVADYASLPIAGETGKIYTTIDNNKIYRWSGSAHVEIAASPGSADSVTEGSVNKYFTEQRVRDTVLTGLDINLTGTPTATNKLIEFCGRVINFITNIATTVRGVQFSGYSKALTSQTIADGDTTQVAVGKLEKKVDDTIINANKTKWAFRAFANPDFFTLSETDHEVMFLDTNGQNGYTIQVGAGSPNYTNLLKVFRCKSTASGNNYIGIDTQGITINGAAVPNTNRYWLSDGDELWLYGVGATDFKVIAHRRQGVQSVKTVSANYTVSTGDVHIFVDTSAGNVTLTLPSILQSIVATGKNFIIQKISNDNNTVTITPTDTTIDGAASYSFFQKGKVDVLMADNRAYRTFQPDQVPQFIPNVISTPGTPTGGGYLYVESGALKYIGSNGTITAIAPA